MMLIQQTPCSQRPVSCGKPTTLNALCSLPLPVIDTFNLSDKSATLSKASNDSPSLDSLKKLGLSEQSILQLQRQFQASDDRLFHADRLLNGKTYLVTQNDKLFYGWPNTLREIAVPHATRSRCINNEQTRDYTAANGLNIRIQAKNSQHHAKATFSLFGLSLPIPHFRQVNLS